MIENPHVLQPKIPMTQLLRDRLADVYLTPSDLNKIARDAIQAVEQLEQANEALRNEAISPQEIRSRDEKIKDLEMLAIKIEAERNAVVEIIKMLCGKSA